MGSTESDCPSGDERSMELLATRGADAPGDSAAVFDELVRLSSAHAQLLRYARDLKRAYEAERERRARLAQATLDLMTVLATTLTLNETAVPVQSDPAVVHAA